MTLLNLYMAPTVCGEWGIEYQFLITMLPGRQAFMCHGLLPSHHWSLKILRKQSICLAIVGPPRRLIFPSSDHPQSIALRWFPPAFHFHVELFQYKLLSR